MRNITFTAHKAQQELIDGLIQSGEYNTESEAINAALKLLEGQHEAKIKRLRSLIDEGLKSGAPQEVNEDAFLRELTASARR